MLKRIHIHLPLALLCGLVLLRLSHLTPFSTIPVAHAHAFVIGSDPVDGSLIPQLPKKLRLFFDGPVSSVSATVVAPDGRTINAGPAYVTGDDHREMAIPVQPQTLQGGYLIRWQALSERDAHTTQGAIGFDVGRSSSGVSGNVIVGPTTSNYAPELTIFGGIAIFWQAAALFCALLWIALLWFSLALKRLDLFTAQGLSSLRTYIYAAIRYALYALLLAELISLSCRAIALHPEAELGLTTLQSLFQLLSTTQYGIFCLLRILLALVALFLLWLYSRQPVRTRSGHKGRAFRQLRQQVHQASTTSPDLAASPTVISAEPQAEHITTRINSTTATLTPQVVSTTPTVLSQPVSSWPLALIALAQIFTLAISTDALQNGAAPLTAVLFSILSLLAQTVLLAIAAGLGYILLPLVPRLASTHARKVLGYLLRRTLPVLLTAIALLLLSQLVLHELTLQNVSQLLSEPYGRTTLLCWLLLALFTCSTGYLVYMAHRKLPAIHAAQPATWLDESSLATLSLDRPTGKKKNAQLSQSDPAPAKPGRGERYIGLTFRFQTWLLVALTLCSALLMFFAPPIVFPQSTVQTRSNTDTAATGTDQTTQVKKVGDLTVSLQILPGKVNVSNTVLLTLLRPDGTLVTDAKVQVVLDMPAMQMYTDDITIPRGNPTYIATLPARNGINMSGLWIIEVTISPPNGQPLQTRFDFVPKT